MSKRHLEEALSASQHLKIEKRQKSLSVTCSLSGFTEDEGLYALHHVDNDEKLLVGTGAEAIKCIPANVRAGDDAYVVTHSVTVKQNQPMGGLPIACIREIPKTHNIALAAAVSGYVYKFDWPQKETGFHAVITQKGNQICSMDINNEGKTMATVGSNSTVNIYDVSTFEAVRDYASVQSMDFDCLNGHVMRLFACKFDPNNENILLTAGWDNMVKVWDLRRQNKDPVKHFSGPHICCSDGLDIKFNKVLTGSYLPSDALQIWDLRQNEVIESFPEDHVYCASFAPQNTVICSSSKQKTLTLWQEGLNTKSETHNVTTNNNSEQKPLSRISIGSPIYSLSLSANQQKLAAGCYNGQVHFVSI